MFAFIFVMILFITGIVLLAMGKRDIGGIIVPLRLIAIIPFALGFFILLATMITTVDGGNVGVKKVFGAYQEGTLKPGLHVKLPWEDIEQLNTRTQAYTMTQAAGEGSKEGDDSMTVTTSDPVNVGVDATIQYVINPNRANDLLQKVGNDYQDKLVRPASRSIIRDEAAKFNVTRFLTDGRPVYAANVKNALEKKLEKYGITIQDVQIRDQRPPQNIADAASAKVAEKQNAEKKNAELSAANIDADIKRTNAKATADAQQIIACGGVVTEVKGEDGQLKKIVTPNVGNKCDQTQLTPAFLQQQYIQAIKDLVNAPNNSTLILPTDSNLTPLLNLPTK